jgi:hypothetical protein
MHESHPQKLIGTSPEWDDVRFAAARDMARAQLTNA